MDRRIPSAGNEEIELYMRTYYSLLRSTGEIQVESLEETHCGMNSSLHLGAEESTPDISAFIYSCMRLPPCIVQVRLVIMGQSDEVFNRKGYPEVERWQPVEAQARRRKMFFDGGETLAVFINSVSDIDDLIPTLTAFQIEWNKLYRLMSASSMMAKVQAHVEEGMPLSVEDEVALTQALAIDWEGLSKLQAAWGEHFWSNLLTMGRHQKKMAIRLLAGSFTDYRRAVQGWWATIVRQVEGDHLREQPVYFVSSNTHSLVNLLSGYALRHQDELVACLREDDPENLWAEYERITAHPEEKKLENFLYYVLRKCRPALQTNSLAWEREHGILRVKNPLYLGVDAQVIELNKLIPERFDSRLDMPGLSRLRQSPALIFNVDYPLGMAAYHLLSQVTTGVCSLHGVYVMGKAATLNGRVGDVLIPNVIFDEHSKNTFLFKNCFAAQDVAPFLSHGTVFDNQKTVTVRGTFLQNRRFMQLFYQEGYTDIEMEAGPYLSAVYENIYPKRFPVNEIVNLFINTPYDIGLIHYASDTPYSRRQELLSRSLSYFGMDSTYAAAIAILRRILAHETQA
jgi:hypothetical protein